MNRSDAPTATDAPALWVALAAVVRRDLLLVCKRPGDLLNPLFFFAMVASLFPLALSPDAEQLPALGAGVLWVAALLATLLSLNSLFVSDFEDASLEQMLLSPQPLPLLVLGKSIGHWLSAGLPLVLLAPLLAFSYRLSLEATLVLVATLLPGTISLSMLGSIGAALTVGLHRGTALLSLLILPLAMPILIFGARTVSLAATGDNYVAGLYFLGAYAVASLTLAPYATAAALRISNE